jgi:hypothetical protein
MLKYKIYYNQISGSLSSNPNDDVTDVNDEPLNEDVRRNLDYFQNSILNSLFIYTKEQSFFCKNDRSYYNIEWILNGVISYNSISSSDLKFNSICDAINKICNKSSATDQPDYLTRYDTFELGDTIIGSGPQQTHIHASYSNTFIPNKNYYDILEKLILTWVNKYQLIFKNKFTEEYDLWADDGKYACGKPLIFSKIYVIEGVSHIKILDEYFKFVPTSSAGIYGNNIEHPFGRIPLFQYKDYYTNVPFFERDDSIDFYDYRYMDLNFQPMTERLDNGTRELHVEFRALNNLVNVGGGVNTFITENFVSINDFLNEFANSVNEYFTEALLGISPENLRFGIEIETCTNVDSILQFSEPSPKKRRT